jgi:UDP-N-acetylglucosamine--N-acetylmuramyl-(pentapeptide) pyrophosphoryl-undecaprenol N-acetylglucosamine transferase
MSPDEFGYDLMEREGVIPIKITSGKWRSYFSVKNFLDLFRVVFGIWEALWNFFLIVPDVVFIKGGYGSLPAVVASILFRVPMIVHESDAVPGKVSRFAGRHAKRIAVSFDEASHFFPPEKTALVGIPIRKNILGGHKDDARTDLNLFSNIPVVGFMGGSQGAEKINSVVVNMLKDMTEMYEVLHQTGERNFTAVKEEAAIVLENGKKERYHAFPFLDDVRTRMFYSASDIIVSRAGATTIYEIATWGKPAILIPLRIAAQDHQKKNAYEYAVKGAALVLEEENVTPHLLLKEIQKILNDPERMQKMSAEAQRFAKIDAAEVLSREILKLGAH